MDILKGMAWTAFFAFWMLLVNALFYGGPALPSRETLNAVAFVMVAVYGIVGRAKAAP